MGMNDNAEAHKAPFNLRRAHPEVGKLKQYLDSGWKDATGLLNGMRRHKVLRVKVSKSQIDRALQIMDALVKALEHRGAKFVTVEHSELKELRVDGERIECLLIEETVRKERDSDAPAWRFNRWEWKATGRLRFEIQQYTPTVGQKKWADSKRHKLEDQIDEIVNRMFATAAALKIWEIEREQQRRQWEQEARLQAEAERRKARELEFRNNLERQSQLWVQAANLRAFIQACEEAMRGEGFSSGDCWEARWLAWARKHSDRIDPLRNGYIEEQKRKRLELMT
jgi:hypothetical protein